MTNRMLDAALRYAARGWPVIPLHTPTDYDRCSCNNTDCPSVGKHPRTMHGLSDASTDPEVVRKWWTQWPKANIGVITNDLVVIDIDPRHGGDESYRDLVAKHGQELTQTLSAVTGGGGQHLVFACPRGVHIGNVANRPGYPGPLGQGVDVRAYGGYIVAPPSLHQSGDRYRWEEEGEQPARLPLALYELLTARPEKQVDHELVSAADILSGVDAGGRDWALFRLAAKLRYADVPYDWARTLVLEAAANAKPAFPANEALKKLDSAYKRYEAGKGAFATQEEARHAEGLDGRVLLDEAIQQGVQPPEWVIEDLVVRGRIHLLYAEPESGKTIIALSWMLDVIAHGGSVVFVDEESGMAAIATLLADMGIESVDDHLHYFPFVGLSIEDAEVLVAYVEQVGAEMVVFDSLTDMLAQAGVDENNGIEVTKWMLGVAQRLARLELAPGVVLIDHVPKDTENIRYAVASRAKKAKADVQWFAKKTEDFDRTKTAFVDLERHKNRPGVLPKKVRYTVGGKDGRLICRRFDSSQDAITALPPRADEFLALVRRGPASRIDVEREMGIGHDSAYRLANALTKAGLVEPKGYGRAQRYHLIVRSDDSNRLADDSESSDESSDFGGLKGPDRTIRRSADKRPWWEKLDDDEEDLV